MAGSGAQARRPHLWPRWPEVVWYNNVRTAQDHADRYNMIFFRALADFCYKARQGYRQKTTIFAVDRGMAP